MDLARSVTRTKAQVGRLEAELAGVAQATLEAPLARMAGIRLLQAQSVADHLAALDQALDEFAGLRREPDRLELAAAVRAIVPGSRFDARNLYRKPYRALWNSRLRRIADAAIDGTPGAWKDLRDSRPRLTRRLRVLRRRVRELRELRVLCLISESRAEPDAWVPIPQN